MNHDELFWSSSDNEDDDMNDEPASVKKEGNDCLGDDHDMAESSHATAFISEDAIRESWSQEVGNMCSLVEQIICSKSFQDKKSETLINSWRRIQIFHLFLFTVIHPGIDNGLKKAILAKI